LKERIAEAFNYTQKNVTLTSRDDVYLFPSGMNAISTALRLIQQQHSHGTASESHTSTTSSSKQHAQCSTIQVGFPYLDSLKLQSVCGASHHLFMCGDNKDLNEIESLLRKKDEHNIQAVFTEYPSNPLLTVADIQSLYALCKQYNVPLLIDDTVSSFASVNTLVYCDATISSLSKWFSGEGDVLAGSLTLNQTSKFYTQFKEQLNSVDSTTQLPLYQDTLYRCDADALEENSRGYIERVEQSLHTTEKLTRFLSSHPLVKRVYAADSQSVPAEVRRFNQVNAVTGLFSLELREPTHMSNGQLSSLVSSTFYDTLRCNKGPSLGTNFTLVCPYTLLAHYNELEWCESVGIPRNLLRVSVGQESVEELIERFGEALDAAAVVYNEATQQRPSLPIHHNTVVETGHETSNANQQYAFA